MGTRWRLREPFNGLSHLAGAAAACAALPFLLGPAQGKPWHLSGLAIYGASLILLYLASAAYHLLPVTPERHQRLLVLDQSAIYLLIAGTYTPVCLVPLRGPWGWSLLAVVWAIALTGIVLRWTWKNAPDWLCFVLYLLLGWLCVVVMGPLTHALPPSAIRWLVLGGLIYTVGAAVFASKRPRLWPGVFSSHELWHVFVLAGSACHFVMMVRFVAPAQ